MLCLLIQRDLEQSNCSFLQGCQTRRPCSLDARTFANIVSVTLFNLLLYYIAHLPTLGMPINITNNIYFLMCGHVQFAVTHDIRCVD